MIEDKQIVETPIQETLERLITVSNRMGIHARPSAMIVQLANQFYAELFVSRVKERIEDEVQTNSKSIMGVMGLTAPYQTVLRFRATGKDAKDLLDAMEMLFASKFAETE